jgi:hypothetical protein
MRKSIGVLLIILMLPFSAKAQMAGSADAIENVGQGKINWTSGEVYATGIGAPPASAVNPAQARAMAERAAMVVALRNLLEIVKGVRVDSESVVENFMTKSDVVRTQVSGIVRGAMPIKKLYLSDGSVEITVAMKMKGEFLNVVVPDDFGSRAVVPAPVLRPAPSMPSPSRPAPPPTPAEPERRAEPRTSEPVRPAPSPSPPPPPVPSKPAVPPPPPVPPTTQGGDRSATTAQFKGGKATGIVIDGRGLGLRPALLPKIIDQQGQEIYVGQVVTRTNAVEQGVAGYAKDVNAAANNFRVTDNPAIIKGIQASGATKTDIVLNSADAQTLRDLSRGGDFLQYCRVIIVY